MAGVSRLQYTNEIRLIRVMCSGRVDLEFILRAFSNGQDGVFIGGCRLNECNYITHGNYDALSAALLCKKLLGHIGVNPERLAIEFMSGGDGILLTRLIDDFSQKTRELGPIGKASGMDKNELKFKFDLIRKLVPYIKLVERERFRIPSRSKEAYHDFFKSDDFARLFDELIASKLELSQIMAFLREKPLSTGEISELSGIDPADVSRHMSRSSRQGFVRYDTALKRYALA